LILSLSRTIKEKKGQWSFSQIFSVRSQRMLGETLELSQPAGCRHSMQQLEKNMAGQLRWS